MGEAESVESTMQLTDSEIEILVQRYTREMARYEEAARLVEDRLRRTLRANAMRVLLSSRAKHPDDLRDKLAGSRRDVQKRVRYQFAALDKDLNSVVTDLAGCRVMVYRFSDVEKAASAVRESFPLADVDNADESHDKPSGYRATHILVQIPLNAERMSLRGTIVEVQVTSLPAHVFNELDHDIGYKDHGSKPGPREEDALKEVRWGTWLLDRSVERLMEERASAVKELEDAEELRFVLEKAAARPLNGDFRRLFQLLSVVKPEVTLSVITNVGESKSVTVKDLLEQGKQAADDLSIPQSDQNDVVHMALALFDRFAEEFEEQVRGWRGPPTLLKKAIEKKALEEAAKERKSGS